MPKYRRKRVLFLCIGNACRSPMAEAIARVDAADAIHAFSAGLAPVGFVEELTRKTLIKNGYPVEDLESKSLSPKVWEQADIVINMSGRAIEAVGQERPIVEDWEIGDAYGEDVEVHQRVFEKIRSRIAELAQRYRDECSRGRMAEARSCVRLYPFPPIFISLNGTCNAKVLDISEGGLALSSDVVLPNRPLRDMRVQFLGSTYRLEVRCRIAWKSESQKLVGIQFVGLTEDLRRHIKNWISVQASHGKLREQKDKTSEQQLVGIQVVGLTEDLRRHIKNWISVQTSHGTLQEQKDKTCEEHNVGLKIPDARQPGSGAPEFSTFGKPVSKHHEAAHFPTPGRTAAQPMPLNKGISQLRTMFAADKWNLAELRQRWGTFAASGLGRRQAVILGVLIGLMSLTIPLLMIRQNAASEVTWAVKQAKTLSKEVKSVAVPHVTETPSALNPSAEKAKEQVSIVEPLPVEKVASVNDSAPKDSLEKAKTRKEPFPNRIVKTQSHSVKKAGPSRKPANESALAAFNGNVSHKVPQAAKTIQAVPSVSQTRSRQVANISAPADPVVPHPSSEARPDEAKSEERPMPSKQPVPAVEVTAAVTTLADPYLSLRVPDRDSSKKQKRGASLQLGHLLSRVEPIYPEEAKQLGIQGTVKLHAIIGRDGFVETLQPVNGPPVLVAAAVNAVRRWRYTETQLAGQSVETEEDIAITFRLSNPAAPKE